MSGGNAFRKAFDYPAIQDSRAIAEIGRGLHIPALTAEAKHNEQNPGRAETKATINAALWYLGGEAGSALNGSGAAADTGATAGEIGSGVGEGGYNALTAQQIAQNLAPVAAGENVGTMGGSLLSGGGSDLSAAQLGQIASQDSLDMGLLGTGAQPSAEQMAILNQAPASVSDLSTQAQPAAVRAIQDRAAMMYGRGRDAVGGLFSHGTMPGAQQDSADMYDQSVRALQSAPKNSMARQLAVNMGLKALSPQQQQAMPRGAPAPQGPQGPLTNPYQSGNPYQPNAYGQGGNSLGLTEEQKQRLRAMGVQI